MKQRKYKHINAFAEKVGVHRINVYRALEKDDPDTWAAYAEFMQDRITSNAYKLKQAKQQIAQIQQPCTHA